MLQVMLNAAKPMIQGLIKQKCQEKIANGEKTINISINDLEKLMLEYLGIDFLNINIKAENELNGYYIELEIDQEQVNG